MKKELWRVCCLLHRDRMFPSNTAAARSRRVWEKWFLVCLLSMFFVCFRRGGAPFHIRPQLFLDVAGWPGFWFGWVLKQGEILVSLFENKK